MYKRQAPYFIEVNELKAQELADEIQKPFKGDDGRRTIANDSHRKQYLEIIERFNNPEDGHIWRNLFSIINQIRPYLMLSVIDSPQSQETVSYTHLLSRLACIASSVS